VSLGIEALTALLLSEEIDRTIRTYVRSTRVNLEPGRNNEHDHHDAAREAAESPRSRSARRHTIFSQLLDAFLQFGFRARDTAGDTASPCASSAASVLGSTRDPYRQAYNLKVVGSNPTPATTFIERANSS
jgi:hypothetical protein